VLEGEAAERCAGRARLIEHDCCCAPALLVRQPSFICVFDLVGSTDRVGGGGATFTPCITPAHCRRFIAIATLVAIF
jgi:hypothetical protein